MNGMRLETFEIGKGKQSCIYLPIAIALFYDSELVL